MDLGSEFQKTNLRIRINILEILVLKFEKTNIEVRINIFETLCMCVSVHVYVCGCVCQFSGETNILDFCNQNLPKNRLRTGNSENYPANISTLFQRYF